MEDPKRSGASRREFLKATALGGAGAVLLPGAARAEGAERGAAPAAGAPAVRAGPATARLFSDAERDALSTLADLVLPGAGNWGAADYVEGLLTSLDVGDGETPRILAGPVGAPDAWLPLDRVRERAWRLRILGSEAVESPNEAVLGPVVGLRPLMLEGAREAAARLGEGSSTEWVWWRLSGDFRDAFTELVLEGTLGDPIYGGNRDGAAWRAFHFEGAPLGYGTWQPMPAMHAHHEHGSHEAGEDADPAALTGPDPLGLFTRAALWIMGVFSRRIA